MYSKSLKLLQALVLTMPVVPPGSAPAPAAPSVSPPAVNADNDLVMHDKVPSSDSSNSNVSNLSNGSNIPNGFAGNALDSPIGGSASSDFAGVAVGDLGDASSLGLSLVAPSTTTASANIASPDIAAAKEDPVVFKEEGPLVNKPSIAISSPASTLDNFFKYISPLANNSIVVS